MTVHTLKTTDSNNHQNDFGETPLPFAPQVPMANGGYVVPQQYLDVCRNLTTLEAVLERVSFSDQYPIFAGELNGVLYLQVGIIGDENYPRAGQQLETKIVYGRRWLIEPTTPTSEVVQTAMLALKKAREHECREKVVKLINQGNNKTTPFNTHMDLPQMAGNPTQFIAADQSLEQQIEDLCKTIRVSNLNLSLHKLHSLDGDRALVELDLLESNAPETYLPELIGQRLSLLCDRTANSDVLHELMNQIIKLSDQYVEEHLLFEGFARFSRNVCVNKLAEFSYQSRNIKNVDQRFDSHFDDMSYQVDSAKAPQFSRGQLGQKQRAALIRHGVVAGYQPLDVSTQQNLVVNTDSKNRV